MSNFKMNAIIDLPKFQIQNTVVDHFHSFFRSEVMGKLNFLAKKTITSPIFSEISVFSVKIFILRHRGYLFIHFDKI